MTLCYKLSCTSSQLEIEEVIIDSTQPKETESPLPSEEAMLPFSSSNCLYKNYAEVIADLKASGFTNIKAEIVYDLIIGSLTKEGDIKEVSIGGNTLFNKGDKYAKDVEIVVIYHSFAVNDPQDDETNEEPPEGKDDFTEPTTTQPPHVHQFSAATCTTPKTCSCGATEGIANGHKWEEANCTSPKTCLVCKITEGAAAGHIWTDATYISPKSCSVCGKTEGNPLDIPGKENYHGHVYTGGSYSVKYHYEEHCAGKNSHEITWDEVVRRGLGPCGTCVLK